ncbi:MAG: hypothetical protein E7A66_07010 [Staphylococcus lugdunensis]|nr:hypothetical protein [Staphylococcus lugdunensis]
MKYRALEMGIMGDGQSLDEYRVLISAEDISGSYHKVLKKHLAKLCETNHILL